MKLVFATNNIHKLKEVREILSNSIEILSLEDIGCFEDIEETATTLEGNAQLKVDHITDHYGFDCFADDTGLEVHRLSGAPGVYSARYGGEHGNSDKNIAKLLTSLNNETDRKAQFRTIVALNLNGESFHFEGICKGNILTAKTGEDGFGYDPIFQPEGFSQSFAQMTSQEKNEISHRGIAIKKLVNFLNSSH